MQPIHTASIDQFTLYRDRFNLSQNDAQWLRDLASQAKPVEQNSGVAFQGRVGNSMHLLDEGWAYTAIEHEDGTRTVLDVHLPGDFIISPGILCQPRRATLYTLTNCKISALVLDDLVKYTQRSAGAGQLFLHILGNPHAQLAQRVVQTTRMPAITRLASFYLDLLERVKTIEPAVQDSFVSPLTNTLVAELLGMTPVHISRTHARLRDMDALIINRRMVEYRNLDLLQQLSVLSDEAIAA